MQHTQALLIQKASCLKQIDTLVLILSLQPHPSLIMPLVRCTAENVGECKKGCPGSVGLHVKLCIPNAFWKALITDWVECYVGSQ